MTVAKTALLARIETHLALKDSSPGFHLSDEDFAEIAATLRAKCDVQNATDWRTIETAPKDGTRIDVWFQLTADHGGRWANVSWSPEHKIWSGGPPSQYKGGWVASHWMPFPAAPSVSSAMGGRPDAPR